MFMELDDFSYSRLIMEAKKPSFEMVKLPYAFDALEPAIDKKTMMVHYQKHYKAYTDKLNETIAKFPGQSIKTAEELLKDLNDVPKKIQEAVRNNAGGYVNHTMFWEIMSPTGGRPEGELADQIHTDFGSIEKFQKVFNEAGSELFGSGWVWLLCNKTKLEITTTPNKNSPISDGKWPIMGNDCWEHAYYLKYPADRAAYLENWWKVANWPEINRRYRIARFHDF